MRTAFTLRPHDEALGWESNERRYFRYAHALLNDLELKCDEVVEKWPVPHDQPVKDCSVHHPELARLLDERNRLSDSVRIYSAMAVEGFLNWYGALRLGEPQFNEHFERLALIPKAKVLLLVCDALCIDRNDPLLVALNKIAQSRNALVHPKAREIESLENLSPRPHSRIPHTAREAVRGMETFFAEFANAVPAASKLVPSQDERL